MPTDAPGAGLYARLSVSGAVAGARAVETRDRPSGARSCNRVNDTASTATSHGAPPRGYSGPQGAPQCPDGTQGQPPAQRAAEGRTRLPEQLTLPPELLAAMALPTLIPSRRRRGRRVHDLPDIANYQHEENQ